MCKPFSFWIFIAPIADIGIDVVLNDALIRLVCKGFYLALTECLHPYLHPLRHSGFVRRFVCAIVYGCYDLGQLLPDLLLRISIDRPLNLLASSGIVAYSIPGLPPTVWPLTDCAVTLGVSCAFP